MSTLADFFPHFSTSESENNIYDPQKLLQALYFRKDITSEAARKLAHFLEIMIWTFVLDSPKLFQVKSNHEEGVKMLRRFCIDRHVEFSKQFFNNQLFIQHDINLLDDKPVIKKAESLYDGEKKIKLSGKLSMQDYGDLLTEKYLPNELKTVAAREILQGLFSLKNGGKLDRLFSINPEKIKSLVLKYFEYSPSLLNEEDQDVNLYFTVIAIILDYLCAEILELSGNIAFDMKFSWISSSIIHNAIAVDEELRKTVFCHMDMLPLVDMTCFYGYNQELPIITINHRKETINFSSIPSELHSNILEHFDSLEILLEMRLVCKQWNHFIMNDNTIWKKLTFNTIISENIFKNCDSTFTITEMEQILESGKHVKPLYTYQQVINYFFDQNDWKTLYFLLVGKHKSYLRDVEAMYQSDCFEKFFQNEIRGNNGYSSYESVFHNSKEKLQLGITGTIEMHKNFTQYKQEETETVLVPKDHFEVFNKIGENMYLVALLDFSQYSCFISCRKLPKRGLLYCFYNREEGKKLIYYFDQLSLTSETLISFKLSDTTFKVSKPYSSHSVKQEQLVVNMDGPSEIFYLQNPNAKLAFSTLVPCFEFSFNDDREHIDLNIYNDDKIVLFSNTFMDMGEVFITLSISISLHDLEKRDFSQLEIISYETNLAVD